MQSTLIDFGRDPKAEPYVSMKAVELSTYLSSRQQKLVDELELAPKFKADTKAKATKGKARSEIKGDQEVQLFEDDTTLVAAEYEVAGSSRKRRAVDDENKQEDHHIAKKSKTF